MKRHSCPKKRMLLSQLPFAYSPIGPIHIAAAVAVAAVAPVLLQSILLAPWSQSHRSQEILPLVQ